MASVLIYRIHPLQTLNSPISPDAGIRVWDGNWHHVAGTFDGAAVHLFLDGSEVGVGTPATTGIVYGLTGGSNVTNDLFIGNYNPNCGANCAEHNFSGEIDEIEIFQRALPAASIATIFAAGQAGKCLPANIEIGRSLRDLLELLFLDRLTVDILGSPPFNAPNIVQSSLMLSQPGDPKASRALACSSQDVNGDTFTDLVCQFPFDVLKLAHKDGTVIVTGQVSVPGGRRTFFGVDDLLKPK